MTSDQAAQQTATAQQRHLAFIADVIVVSTLSICSVLLTIGACYMAQAGAPPGIVNTMCGTSFVCLVIAVFFTAT